MKNQKLMPVLILALISISISCGNVTQKEIKSESQAIAEEMTSATLVMSIADLPACSAAILGKLFYVKSIAKFKFCNDLETYEDIELTGAKGDIGLQGIQGDAGTTPWNITGSDLYFNTGMVGIGTNSPASLLHIFSTTNVAHSIIIDAQGSLNNQKAVIDLITLGDGTKAIDNAATNGWHLAAKGNAHSTTDEQNDLMLYYWNGTTPNKLMHWDNTGKVGIGATNPSHTLTIGTGTSTSLAYPRVNVIAFADGDAGFGIKNNTSGVEAIFQASGLGVYFGSTSNHTVVIRANDLDKVYITSDKAALDVNGYMRLKKYSAEPVACDATSDRSITLASSYTTCVCKSGTGWVKTSDGLTACVW